MPRQTLKNPERGDARTRLLEAARDVIRRKGYAATTVDDICREAEVTKGAYFHHFKSKEALGVAVARYWDETTGDMFQNATYHKLEDPLDRVLGYLDLREELIDGDLAEFTCLVGTMTQEAYQSHKPILDACASCIFDHAQTLEEDIQKAIQIYGVDTDSWNAQSLAQYTQAALQGGFILAKAAGNAEPARESVRHLRRYIELLFNRPSSN